MGQRDSARGGRRMTARERLRNRRVSKVFDIELYRLRYVVGFSRFDDGRVAEIFLQNHKPVSQSDSYARDSAIAASLALQYGCPLEVLRRALLRDPQGRASTPLGVALDIIAQDS